MPSLIDGLLDATIVFSFDRTGFRRHARAFAAGDLEVRLEGKTCLVTGANSGIGRQVALGLARRGARVRLLCRHEGRGREAEASLRQESGNDRVFLDVLDVSELAAIRAYARALEERTVDVLVHNAGVLPAERQLSSQGLEVTFATHVAGPYLLGRLLEPRLREAGAAREIFVTSGGAYGARLSLEDLDWSRRPYDGVAAYAQTKRMQIVLAEVLGERLRGSGIVVHAMHPGWADTPAVRTSLPRFYKVTRRILRTPEEGADTALWLAVAAEPARSTGQFWFDRSPRRKWLVPGTRETPAERERLLALLEEIAREWTP